LSEFLAPAEHDDPRIARAGEQSRWTDPDSVALARRSGRPGLQHLVNGS
jgi:hypothetical protein